MNNHISRKSFFGAVLLAVLLVPAQSNAQTIKGPVDQALDHLRFNRPVEAIPLLESAIRKEPGNDLLYNYLGTAWLAMKEFQKAEDSFRDGAKLHGPNEHLLYYNAGVALEGQNKKLIAVEMYSKAIELRSSYVPPYYGRGIIYTATQKYKEALADMVLFLKLDPSTERRAKVEQLIAILTRLLKQQEDDRLALEKKTEEERLVAEKKKKEEEERRKKALDDVLDSLDKASEDTKNLSGGTDKLDHDDQGTDIYD
jgi:tetratricopeptide (TPR) repeat protein